MTKYHSVLQTAGQIFTTFRNRCFPDQYFNAAARHAPDDRQRSLRQPQLSSNFPDDWAKYRFSYMVHKPQGIEPETVYIADNYVKNRLYRTSVFPSSDVAVITAVKKYH